MTRRRGRRGWHLSSVLFAVPVAVLSFFRAVPSPWPTPVVQLVAFTPWLVFPAAAALLLALPSRRPWAVLPAAGLLALQLVWLFPPDRLLDRPGDPRQDQGAGASPRAPAAELKIMSLNAKLGQADAAAIVRLVRENGIALLALQELSPAFEQRLDAEGLDALLPHRVSHPLNGAGGSGVYAARPLIPLDSAKGTVFPMHTLQLSLEVGGQPVPLAVTNVHAQAPVEGQAARWRSDLAAVGSLAARPGNLLLLGDFNATFDHAEFRELLSGGPVRGGAAGGLVDVGIAARARLTPTWPTDGQLLPGVVIDHIVTSPHLRSSGYSVQAVAGTDHAAVLATLSVPAGG
ncbi:endonuclease/exonuclease/phosphatase family metal-dependent hydrolase [Arthrobacter sp. V4I6]|uniref:endonuclease/exonuclease/phosphatase family protein n=1 Tax=unclassified Arthrobacter TaxID=235627 RepID=UPI00278AC6C5|nr:MULTISPECIES: endonuclease/exonuclease/phosphatase family protein [unclassified Arthrobacter]MDQ0820640.1 endonuclease/exonuclease/phosphatase family metal-dependent hydrolase [Arthrobacter sp. V1I7]MDQ0854898.1 endonuclease/exonuclease/phosphatase family metal-dependent hydrolase [Arthrobacter sp. V4I6]